MLNLLKYRTSLVNEDYFQVVILSVQGFLLIKFNLIYNTSQISADPTECPVRTRLAYNVTDPQIFPTGKYRIKILLNF